MASFDAHIKTAAMLSIAGTAAAIHCGIADANEAAFLIVCGMLGGILPDIDSDSGLPLRVIFAGLAVAADGLFEQYGIFAHIAPIIPPIVGLDIAAHVTIVCAIAWVIYVPLMSVFKAFTTHRGVWHSLLACGVVFLAVRPLFGDIAAYFVSGGFVWHLVLDEMYSLYHARKSLGTALKLIGDVWWANLGFALVAWALIYVNFYA